MPERPSRSRLRELAGTYGFAVSAGILLALVMVFCRFYLVPTASMDPVIAPGARVVALAIPYGITHRFERGDVAVFDSPVAFPGQPKGEALVKRVVGLGGDTVSVNGGILYVDGKPSPWQGTSPNVGSFSITVPAGCYFMMGDNRNDSLDSRYFGPVDVASTRARVLAVYLPYFRSL